MRRFPPSLARLVAPGSRNRLRLIGLLLWLLPLGQSLALWHGLSHLAPSAPVRAAAWDAGSPEPRRGESAAEHCDLCLMAASVCAAVLGGAACLRVRALAGHVRRPALPRSVWLAPLVPAYLSRGPPFARR